MRLGFGAAAIFLGLLMGGSAQAQTTNCMVNGPFINCHTVGGGSSGSGGSSFWEAFRAGQEARDRREARQNVERRQAMIVLLRMAQQVNASVPAGVTPEQALAYRAAGLDRAYDTLRASGIRIPEWERTKADLLAYPELATQALTAMGEASSGAQTAAASVQSGQAPSTAARVAPVSSPHCTALLQQWDASMQQGDRSSAQRYEAALRAECRR